MRCPAKETVLTLNKFLLAKGATYEEDCFLLLNDTAEVKFDEVETGLTLAKALEKIYSWDNLGLIEYYLYGGLISVHFHTTVRNYLEAITINILRSVYYEREREKYLHFCIDLHYLLHSKRTIMGYDLEEPRLF